MKQPKLSVSEFLAQYESNERFSNFNQNDLTFTPDDLTANAAGERMAYLPVSKPYVVQFQNTTGTTLNAILFGWNDYGVANGNSQSGTPNWGSATGINVSVPIPNDNYGRMIGQTANKPFDVGYWRLTTGSSTTSQLSQNWSISYVDGNGRSCTDPVIVSIYTDPYQFSSTIVDIHYPVKVDANTYITIPILANTTLTIVAFPQSIADVARQTIGNGTLGAYKIPRIAAKNATVIQASTVVDSSGAGNTPRALGGGG